MKIPAQLLTARRAVDFLTPSLIDRIISVCSYKVVPVGVVDENVCGVIEELGAQVASDWRRRSGPRAARNTRSTPPPGQAPPAVHNVPWYWRPRHRHQRCTGQIEWSQGRPKTLSTAQWLHGRSSRRKCQTCSSTETDSSGWTCSTGYAPQDKARERDVP